MPKVYIANTSVQNQIINYRLPDSNKVMTQQILQGQQQIVGGLGKDLSPPEIEGFVDQMSIYGLTNVTDINKIGDRVVPYIYSVGTVIKSVEIIRVIEHNKTVLKDQGKDRRRTAAVGINNALEQNLPLNQLEVSVEEETSGSFASETPEPIAEGYTIHSHRGRESRVNGRGKGRNK